MTGKKAIANVKKNMTQPPNATKRPEKLVKHNNTRIDNYYWMKERDTKDILNYLHKENDYAEAILKPTEKLQKTIFKEMKSRIIEDETSTPYKKGPFYYYIKFKKGAEYPIYVRYELKEHKKKKRKEEILLDGNKMAKGKDYYDLGAVGVSQNQEILSYAVDTVGRRFYTFYFKNLKTGKLLKDTIPNVTGNLVWANDNETVYYTAKDPNTLRSYKVFRKKLGEEPELIFTENDELFSVIVDKSLNDKTLFILTGGITSNETLYADANAKNPEFKVFLPREDKHEYSVEDGDDRFFILSNWKAENFRAFDCDKKNTQKSKWREILPHDKNVLLENISVFKNYLVLSARKDGLTQLYYSDREFKKLKSPKYPEKAYMVSLGANAEYETETLRYVYESMVTPTSTLDLNMETDVSVVIREKKIPNYNKKKYTADRLWATAQDGKKIPISLIYNTKLFKPGKNPLLVYGYGSYGLSLDPEFSSAIVSLLDRGFVYAYAHIRGGSEMGRHWYENGKFLNKKNTFNDFISVTEHLIKEKWGDPKKIYASGGSAGGLLVGAVMNMRPDLYHGIIAQVPFVDVVTTMLDSTIPLTTGEYEEWGNPNDKKYYDYMLSYSPYDNVESKKYPNVFIYSGYHDSQVQYWEPTKWAAKLRDFNQSDSKIVLKTDMDSGHSGATGRFKRLKEAAIFDAFIIWLAGIDK